jgi:hypothetical protein
LVKFIATCGLAFGNATGAFDTTATALVATSLVMEIHCAGGLS